MTENRANVATVHRVWYIDVGNLRADKAMEYVSKFKEEQEKEEDYKRSGYVDYYIPADYTRVEFHETSL